MKAAGITSCSSGMVRTYMTAGAFKLAEQKLGIEVLIEIQGGAGVESQLKQKNIGEAVYVILVNDVALEGIERFRGRKVPKMGVSDLIKKPDTVMKEIQDTFQQGLRGILIGQKRRRRWKEEMGKQSPLSAIKKFGWIGISGPGGGLTFSGRMLGIIHCLKLHRTFTLRETVENLKVLERNIWYDVDRINDIPSLEKLPEIEKHSKGVLVLPEGLDLKELGEKMEVIYTSREWISVLFLILPLRSEELKMNQLSHQLKVPRSTVKNDVGALDGEPREGRLSIGYSDHFYLEGSERKRTTLLNQGLKKYINHLINPFTNYNSYEFHCIHIIHMTLGRISIPSVVLAVNELLKYLNCTSANTFYARYVSNAMVPIWFITRRKEYSLDSRAVPGFDREKFGEFLRKLEGTIGRPMTEEHVCLMARLPDFTNKFAGINKKADPVHVEAAISSLISAMLQEMGLPFNKGKTLAEGLLNHMIPLIQRIQDGIEIRDNMMLLLGPEELKLHGLMKQVCGEVDTLEEITNRDEISYLTACSVVSTHRMKNTPYKRMPLVCGHGYGTMTMPKEPLLNGYQIHIKDTAPLYKISPYPDWAGIDFTFSMTPFDNSLPKPCIVVSPILQARDEEVIESLGVVTKAILPSYYVIEERLTFLDEKTQMQATEVTERELEYQTVKPVRSPKNSSSFLKFDCIAPTDLTYSWQQAVEMSALLLLKHHPIERVYLDGMLDLIEKQGSYSMTDGFFAFPHGGGDGEIEKTSFSLLMNKQSVAFEDRKVKIIFCLVSRDGREHTPAVVTLMRVVETTSLIQDLERCKSEEEIYQTVLNCEFEVLQKCEIVGREDKRTGVLLDWDACLYQE